MDSTSAAEQERRRHHQIREVFIKACELLEPIVTGNDTVKTVSAFAMAHMVHDHFPELTSSEAHIVVSTVEKMHREQRLQALLKKQG
jgi:hypothetical protein